MPFRVVWSQLCSPLYNDECDSCTCKVRAYPKLGLYNLLDQWLSVASLFIQVDHTSHETGTDIFRKRQGSVHQLTVTQRHQETSASGAAEETPQVQKVKDLKAIQNARKEKGSSIRSLTFCKETLHSIV